MKNQICNHLTELLPETTADQLLALMETPPDVSMGDFALPCFAIAKMFRKNPKLIAEEVAEGLMVQAMALGIEKVEAVNGYCNIFLNRAAYVKQCLTMAMGLGCNAAGVTGCRIIDSPRERLIAILTNNFVPCNGRFPTLIAIILMAVTPNAARCPAAVMFAIIDMM